MRQARRRWSCVLLLLLLWSTISATRKAGRWKEGRASRTDPAERALNRDRLALVMLVTELIYKGLNRTSILCAAIRLADKHLLPSTPYTLYVFTRQHQVPIIQNSLASLLRPHVFVLPVTEDSWALEEAARDRHYWHGYWGESYRLMGDWRLKFMPAFARDRGHRYVVQIDDDSFILGPIKDNLIEVFDRDSYLMGAQRIVEEPPLITWGLPELAKFFLMTYAVMPTTLLQHCNPPNLKGLYTALTGPFASDPELDDVKRLYPDIPTSGGWDRTVLNGNFVMLSLDFWFQPLVQRFVQLCRNSGSSVMYRWNEQAVMGMVSQMFVPDGKVYNFTFPYGHRMKARDALRAGGLEP